MDKIRERLIHIHHCRGVGWKTIASFFHYDPSLESIYKMDIKMLFNLFSISRDNAEQFYKDLHNKPSSVILNQLSYEKIKAITIFDEDYPKLLKEIYDPPWVLYAKGDINLLKHERKLAVVGTRNPTSYGYNSLKKILVPIIHENCLVVSGLALGIDTLAHQLTVEEKGKTIAVLGSGFRYIYPLKNRTLASEIAKNHLLITEYQPQQKPQRWQFPQRNRIISGLCKGVLIVEAKERSGSNITADQALEQGRDVYAIPGSIFNPASAGPNKLIQNGAKLVMSSDDILEEWI